MKQLKMVGASCVALMWISLVTISHAATVNVTFDEPNYVDGELPPAPWSQDYDVTNFANISAGSGYGGTQGLAVTYDGWSGVTYDSPTVLTSDSGESIVSMMIKTGNGNSSYNFMTYAGMQVGRGNKKFDSAYYLGLIFRKVSGSNGIYGPGGGVYGTYLSAFATEQWYELTFKLNAAWDTMTLSAGPVGGSVVSMNYAWDGGDISRVWVLGADTGTASVYDNLNLVPEPSTMNLLALGIIALVRRRRAE